MANAALKIATKRLTQRNAIAGAETADRLTIAGADNKSSYDCRRWQ